MDTAGPRVSAIDGRVHVPLFLLDSNSSLPSRISALTFTALMPCGDLRALFSGIEREGSRQELEPISAREWGRKQAAASPMWSEEKWQRIGVILGVDFSPATERADRDEEQVQERSAPGWSVAA